MLVHRPRSMACVSASTPFLSFHWIHAIYKDVNELSSLLLRFRVWRIEHVTCIIEPKITKIGLSVAYWWPNWRLNCSKLLMPFGQISRELKIYFTIGGNQRVHWGLPEAFLLQVLNIIGCEKANRKVWFSDQTWIDRRDRSTWSDWGECHSRSTNMRSWHGLGRYSHFATKRNLGMSDFSWKIKLRFRM